ncbi:MAG: hypothetical protein J6V53_07395 [Alphaproteobacteria bacterium]|nr:hypothetical protein [Alphaproteobacteria bacterium]
MNTFFYLLQPLLLTIFIEVIVSFCYQVRTIKDFGVIILAQVITNPLINLCVLFIYIQNNALLYGLYLFFGELFVLMAETFFYKLLLFDKKINPFRLATFCNLTSFGIGVVYVLINELIKIK